MNKVNTVALWCFLILLGAGVATSYINDKDQEKQFSELQEYSKDHSALQREVEEIVYNLKNERYVDPTDVLMDHWKFRKNREIDSIFACMDDQVILNVSYSLLKRCAVDESISREQIVEEYLNNKSIYNNLPKTDINYYNIGNNDGFKKLNNDSIIVKQLNHYQNEQTTESNRDSISR